MKRSVMPAGIIFILAGVTLPAVAQTPAQPRVSTIVPGLNFEPVTGKFTPFAATTAPDPNAVPGFFDRATGKFTPLVSTVAASGSTVAGTFHYIPFFRFDPDFSGDDSIFCSVTLIFGNLVNNQFFSNHTARASFNFGSENALSIDVAVPYKYTPNSPNAVMRVEVDCIGFGDSGEEHSFTEIHPVGDLPNGNVDFNDPISF